MKNKNPELRFDSVRQEWVIIAPGRAKRPEEFAAPPKKIESENEKCFFCEGHEKETPSEVLAYDGPARKPDTPGWDVRVFPNKFPALVPGENFAEEEAGIFSKAEAVGFHEIIVTKDHAKPPALFTTEEMAMMFRAYQERFLAHCCKDVIKYVLIIYNHGKEAGASLVHPHSQLFALPVISNDLQIELEGSKKFHEKEGECVFCKMLKDEINLGTRIVYENDGFVALAPYVSQNPFETWVLPKNHEPLFQKISDEERLLLGDCMRTILKKYYDGLNNPSFNYYIQSAPCDGQGYPYYHWHLEILPRLATRAGFEFGTGMAINIVDPDEAAQFLREVKIN